MSTAGAPAFAAVLFDLDGTLIDSRADIAAAVNHTLVALGRAELPLERVQSYIGDGVRVLMERAFADADAALIDRAIAVWRPWYLEHCLDGTRLYPGVRELLDALTGLPLGVVSNKPAAPSERILAGLGVRDRFGAVLGGDSAPTRKPDPGPLLLAAEQLGCGARRGAVLMVGDSRNDVEAARRAGFASCGVLWGIGSAAEVRAARPDYIAATAGEVAALVLGRKP
ncbi:MAG: HAD-IA family hydrolase [Planctomycetes bacterium]|nr:HAD-IA family hydrolase [Planctomycetota bacterium]